MYRKLNNSWKKFHCNSKSDIKYIQTKHYTKLHSNTITNLTQKMLILIDFDINTKYILLYMYEIQFIFLEFFNDFLIIKIIKV